MEAAIKLFKPSRNLLAGLCQLNSNYSGRIVQTAYAGGFLSSVFSTKWKKCLKMANKPWRGGLSAHNLFAEDSLMDSHVDVGWIFQTAIFMWLFLY